MSLYLYRDWPIGFGVLFVSQTQLLCGCLFRFVKIQPDVKELGPDSSLPTHPPESVKGGSL